MDKKGSVKLPSINFCKALVERFISISVTPSHNLIPLRCHGVGVVFWVFFLVCSFGFFLWDVACLFGKKSKRYSL